MAQCWQAGRAYPSHPPCAPEVRAQKLRIVQIGYHQYSSGRSRALQHQEMRSKTPMIWSNLGNNLGKLPRCFHSCGMPAIFQQPQSAGFGFRSQKSMKLQANLRSAPESHPPCPPPVPSSAPAGRPTPPLCPSSRSARAVSCGVDPHLFHSLEIKYAGFPKQTLSRPSQHST